MLQTEKEKLFSYDNEYISIAITENGETYGRYPIPWDITANAYNMKIPNVYIAKNDLHNEKIMQKICKFRVQGCYIFCELQNYDFLNRFVDMYDLNIYQAYNLKDLSFLKSFNNCRLLFVSRAHLKNIDEVISNTKSAIAHPKNLALYNCVVDDISKIKESDCYFHELIICNPKERDERLRWDGIKNLKYYDFKE